jgi:hypothetical protein
MPRARTAQSRLVERENVVALVVATNLRCMLDASGQSIFTDLYQAGSFVVQNKELAGTTQRAIPRLALDVVGRQVDWWWRFSNPRGFAGNFGRRGKDVQDVFNLRYHHRAVGVVGSHIMQ